MMADNRLFGHVGKDFYQLFIVYLQSIVPRYL